MKQNVVTNRISDNDIAKLKQLIIKSHGSNEPHRVIALVSSFFKDRLTLEHIRMAGYFYGLIDAEKENKNSLKNSFKLCQRSN